MALCFFVGLLQEDLRILHLLGEKLKEDLKILPVLTEATFIAHLSITRNCFY